MGCGASKGLLALSQSEIKKLRTLNETERRKAEVASVLSESSPYYAGTIIQLDVDLKRNMNMIVVNQFRFATFTHGFWDDGKRKISDVHLLAIKSLSGGTGTVPYLLEVEAMNQKIQLQTTYLKDVVTAIRQGLAYLTVGTPPQYLPFSFKVSPELMQPLPQVPIDGNDGGFSNQLKGFLSYLKNTSARNINLQNSAGEFVCSSPEDPPSVNRGPSLWVSTVCQMSTRANKSVDAIVQDEVAVLRSLRFNLFFTALYLNNCVDDQQGSFWKALMEVCGYNISLAELHLPNVRLSSANWVALGQALLYSPRPFFTVWNLQGNNIGDGGLAALLPGMARIFCTISPPQYLDLSYNGLTPQIVWPFIHMLLGEHPLVPPNTPAMPVPPPPFLGRLTLLSLSGNNLRGQGSQLASLLEKLPGLLTLRLDDCMLLPDDFAFVCTALINSVCPLQEIGLGNVEVIQDFVGRGKQFLNDLLLAKEKTLTQIMCNIGTNPFSSQMLDVLMENYSKPFPKIRVQIFTPALVQVQPKLLGNGNGLGSLEIFGPTDLIPAIMTFTDYWGLKRVKLNDWVPQPNQQKEVVTALSQFVQRSQNLTVLIVPGGTMKLQHNILPLLAAVAISKSLEELDVQSHGFGDKGAEALGQALRTNRSLRKVWFDNNQIRLAGLKGFRGCLYGNQKLIEVGLPVGDFGLYQESLKSQISQGVQAEAGLRANIKVQYRQRRGHHAQQQAIQQMVNNKKAYKAVMREQAKAQKIMQEIQKDLQRNLENYNIMLQRKQQEKAARQQAVFVQKWTTKQVDIKTKLQAKVNKLRKEQEKKGNVYQKHQYYNTEVYRDPYRRQRDEQGDYYYCNGQRVYYNDPYYDRYGYSNTTILFIDTSPGYGYGYCPPYQEYGYDWQNNQQGYFDSSPGIGNIGNSDFWLPGDLIPPNPLDGLDNLLQQPDFFHPDNLAQFDQFASGMGADIASGFQSGLNQAGALTADISNQAQSWGTDLGSTLQNMGPDVNSLFQSGLDQAQAIGSDISNQAQDIGAQIQNTFQPDSGSSTQAPAAEPEDPDEIVMYGGAGPRDLPDEGSSGGSCGTKVLAGGFARALSLQHKKDTAPNICIPEVQRLIKDWDDAMTEIAGEHSPLTVLEYEMVPHFLVSNKAVPDSEQVTLVTQCSVDRLGFLKAQVVSWNSICSLAIYINTETPEKREQELEQVRVFFQELDQVPKVFLDIAVCFGLEQKPWMDVTEKSLYPINTLRNLAFTQAMDQATNFVFLVDADFLPSDGLAAYLNEDQQAIDLLSNTESKSALVVPAFELAGFDITTTKVPSSKCDITKSWNDGLALGFHTTYYPKGHSPTEYQTWLQATEIYQITYQENFEPYIVVRKDLVPLYDERFRGYGMNKIAHIFNMQADGCCFFVAPHHFIVAHPHPRSSSWQATYGTNKDLMQKYRLQHLWRCFKSEIIAKTKANISSATRTFWELVNSAKGNETVFGQIDGFDKHPSQINIVCEKYCGLTSPSYQCDMTLEITEQESLAAYDVSEIKSVPVISMLHHEASGFVAEQFAL